MFSTNGNVTQKIKTEVELVLTDGPLKVINKAMIAHITPVERLGNMAPTG
jgi:hypothetical protein